MKQRHSRRSVVLHATPRPPQHNATPRCISDAHTHTHTRRNTLGMHDGRRALCYLCKCEEEMHQAPKSGEVRAPRGGMKYEMHSLDFIFNTTHRSAAATERSFLLQVRGHAWIQIGLNVFFFSSFSDWMSTWSRIQLDAEMQSSHCCDGKQKSPFSQKTNKLICRWRHLQTHTHTHAYQVGPIFWMPYCDQPLIIFGIIK